LLIDIEQVDIKTNHRITYLYYSYCLYIHVDIHQQDMYRLQDNMVGWHSGNFQHSYFQMFPIHILQKQWLCCVYWI